MHPFDDAGGACVAPVNRAESARPTSPPTACHSR